MEKITNLVAAWSRKRFTGIFIFNLVLIVLVLLNTAGYFKPFFYLGINTIFFISFILAVIMLGVRARVMFLISLAFLLFTAFLRIMRIEVWADRASIYFYQSFFLGLLLLLWRK